jgi:hypothetical protein
LLLIRPINAIINNSQIFDRDILLVKLEAVVLTTVLAATALVAPTEVLAATALVAPAAVLAATAGVVPAAVLAATALVAPTEVLAAKAGVVPTEILAATAGVAPTFFVRVVSHNASDELVILMVKLSSLRVKFIVTTNIGILTT